MFEVINPDAFCDSSDLFPIFHVGKTFPFEDFFHPEEQNIFPGMISNEYVVYSTGVEQFLAKNLQRTQRGALEY